MSLNEDIRWKQRFSNFEKSFWRLEKSLSIERPSETEKAGIIQFFEINFELSWKLMKDYLETLGFDLNSPRSSIKQAFQSEIISDGHIWLEALQHRNKTTHIYDDETADKILKSIKTKYFPAIKEFYEFMKSKIEK